MEGKAETGCEVAREGEVGVGFSPAQAVVQVCGVQDQAEFAGSIAEGAKQGYRIGSAGEADGKTQAGLEQRGVEGKSRRRWSAHQRMISRLSGVARCDGAGACLALHETNPMYSAAGWRRAKRLKSTRG